MLITETVYSVRKRAPWLQWLGSLRLWLSFHIFTGIVGPFLVLLHSAFSVGGVAGLALGLAWIVVMSGLFGRYVYTAVPRTRAGIEWSRDELAARVEELEKEMEAWLAHRPMAVETWTRVAGPPLNPRHGLGVLLRTFSDFWYSRRVHAMLRTLERVERTRFGELERLLRRRRRLERQMASLDWAHRWMSLWRLAHLPLGAALFTSALVHMIGVLYYKGLPFLG
jgi:hypothetical protein